MKKWLFVLPLAFTLALLGAVPTKAARFDFHKGSFNLEQEEKADLLVTSDQSVNINKPVGGELFSFANQVTINTAPARSIVLGGRTVLVNQGSGYNAALFGNEIKIDGDFANDVYIFNSCTAGDSGYCFEMADTTKIKGDLRIYSDGLVKLAGNISGNVIANARAVESSAVIEGMLSGNIKSLEFTGGSLKKASTYTSDSEAVGIEKLSGPVQLTRQNPPTKTESVWGSVFNLLATLLFGVLIILLIPKRIKRSITLAHKKWGASFGIGLAWLVIVPILIVIMAVTIVGWKVAVILGLFYGVTLILSAVMSAIWLGAWLMKRFAFFNKPNLESDHQLDPTIGFQISSFLLGAILIGVLTLIPYLGGVIGFAAFLGLALPAVGAFLMRMREEEK